MRRDILCSNIRNARLAAGLTQEDLAHLAGMQTAVYSRVERGAVNPQIETVVRIAQALEIPIDDIVHGIDRR